MMPAAIRNLHAMEVCRSGLSAVLAYRQHSACCGHGEQLRHMVVWLPSAADSFALSRFPARSPYHYGFITELKAVGSGFAYENVKHYTMGRISHEMGCVSVLQHYILVGIYSRSKLHSANCEALDRRPHYTRDGMHYVLDS